MYFIKSSGKLATCIEKKRMQKIKESNKMWPAYRKCIIIESTHGRLRRSDRIRNKCKCTTIESSLMLPTFKEKCSGQCCVDNASKLHYESYKKDPILRIEQTESNKLKIITRKNTILPLLDPYFPDISEKHIYEKYGFKIQEIDGKKIWKNVSDKF